MIKKRFISIFFLYVISLFLLVGISCANEENIYLPISFADGSTKISLGNAILKGEELWVSVDAMEKMGVSLIDAQNNNKGFYLNIENPAKTFDIESLSNLAGETLSLYFSSKQEEGISYFNVVGMEALTGLAFEKNEAEVTFYKNSSTLAQLLQKRMAKPKIKEKISLVWAHITRDNPNLLAEEPLLGLGIISPTWFNLIDGSGLMANRASVSYVEAAHSKNYQVWALVSNGFNQNNTTQFFKNNKAVSLFIARLLAYSKLYNLDGINFDFENVDVNDKDAYVRFISLAAPLLKKAGLSVSVDVHIPSPNSNLSKSHDRGFLSKHVDYVMLMAYDEHWRTSPKAGSVASMPWVERAVQNTINEGVPSTKLILGVPFYMRRWEETAVNGKTIVKAVTLTMDESNSILASKGIKANWNDELGQFYYAYKENGKTYKVWVENAESIKRKFSLIKKYNLAGAAGWRKGHESADIWDIFDSEFGGN